MVQALPQCHASNSRRVVAQSLLTTAKCLVALPSPKAVIAEQQAVIAEQQAVIAEQQAVIAEQQAVIVELQRVAAGLQLHITGWKEQLNRKNGGGTGMPGNKPTGATRRTERTAEPQPRHRGGPRAAGPNPHGCQAPSKSPRLTPAKVPTGRRG